MLLPYTALVTYIRSLKQGLVLLILTQCCYVTYVLQVALHTSIGYGFCNVLLKSIPDKFVQQNKR